MCDCVTVVQLTQKSLKHPFVGIGGFFALSSDLAQHDLKKRKIQTELMLESMFGSIERRDVSPNRDVVASEDKSVENSSIEERVEQSTVKPDKDGFEPLGKSLVGEQVSEPPVEEQVVKPPVEEQSDKSFEEQVDESLVDRVGKISMEENSDDEEGCESVRFSDNLYVVFHNNCPLAFFTKNSEAREYMWDNARKCLVDNFIHYHAHIRVGIDEYELVVMRKMKWLVVGYDSISDIFHIDEVPGNLPI